MQGIVIIGRVLGLKSKDRTDSSGNPMLDPSGKQVKEWEVGVSVPVPDGFEGETETLSLRISGALISAGIPALYAKAVGHTVVMPARVQIWKSKAGNTGSTWWLAGDGKPEVYKPSAAAAA